MALPSPRTGKDHARVIGVARPSPGGFRSEFPFNPARQDGAEGEFKWTFSTRTCENWSLRSKAQGYLTYDEVTRYLPDEAVDPEKLDNLLVLLDQAGIKRSTVFRNRK